MRLSIARAFLPVAFSLFLLCGPAAMAQGQLKSGPAKLQAIQKLVDDYKKSGESLSDPDVRKIFLADLAKAMPLDAKGALDSRSVKALMDEALAMAVKQFPKNGDQVSKDAEKEAETAIALAKPREKVSITYKRGESYYKVEGVFYSNSGGVIKVGDKTVAIMDILPEYKAKFDPEFNARLRKDFVAQKIQAYLDAKESFRSEALKKLGAAQTKNNEDANYIYFSGAWKSPKDIALALLSAAIAADKAAKEEAAKEEAKEAKAAAQTAAPAQAPAAAAAPVAAAPAPAPVAKAEAPEAPAEAKPALDYDSIKKAMDARLSTIANTCAGIDSDQGYKNILWGLGRDEAALLLSKSPDAVFAPGGPQDSFDTLTPKDKDDPIKEVEFHYVSDVLVKVVVYFNLSDYDGAVALREKLLQKYGLNDEQIKAIADAKAEAAKAETAKKAEESKDGKKDDKKKDDKKKPLPLEMSYHWTGKITTATIFFKMNGTRSAFDEIKLVKMNVSLMRKLNDEQHRLKEEAIKKQREETRRKLDNF